MKSLLALAIGCLLSSLSMSNVVPLEENQQDAGDEEHWSSHYGNNETGFEPTNCKISIPEKHRNFFPLYTCDLNAICYKDNTAAFVNLLSRRCCLQCNCHFYHCIWDKKNPPCLKRYYLCVKACNGMHPQCEL